MLLNNFSIRNKLLMSAAVPMLSIILIILVSLSALKEADLGVGRIYDDRLVPLEDLKTIADNYAVYVIDAVNKANAGVMTAPDALRGIQSARAEIRSKWKKYLSTTLTVDETRLAEEASRLFFDANSTLDNLEKTLSSAGSGSISGQFNDYDGPLYQIIDPISEKITELVSLQLTVAGLERKNIDDAYYNQIFIMLTMGGSVLATLITISYLVYQSITKPLNSLNQAMDMVATHSDLTISVPSIGKDELANMANSFNTMLHHQRTLIGDISNAIYQLASAADEMTSVSTLANQNIDRQRLEIEQVASAMNEMVSTSQDVASNAEQADQSAQTMREQAEAGSNIVGIAVSATNSLVGNVADISERIRLLGADSDSIGSIVDVINDIADQTNLLALNAAIEAARAGDQGRGFAVVADEVRTLAQRTQTSTTEIRETIERLQNGTRSAVTAMKKSQTEAEQAGSKSSEVSNAFQNIANSVASITEMNTHIASASEEQSCVCEEINRSLVSINDSAQESSQGALQISTASEELASLAAKLSIQVGKFKT
ncbi:methyl-accepting chemotaxis protein [Neptunomonas antarctica]|uniref:Methyl-accepting chemotaxis sensory transducer n=1 Tax=Neptunomonas antarctica TaxID=619304 RepID=A0A1N7P1D7_9GAMM|nr:methyl-accepting chemotaxis protein [Neptunomonas antarctica]SIT04368.1 methyl-accepting chemotaxis sensory transducer [Neptunomonas antarctica]